jgi:hypothetical protein
MPGVISKKGSKKLLKVISARAKKLVSDPKFKARMASINSIPIIKKYDIPYLAGYSVDGKTVYIDRHLKTEWKGEDLSKFLRLHEITEKTLLDIDGLTYQEAHHIATHYERMAVEKAGLNWNEYTKYLDPFIKKVHHEHLYVVPKNLALTPYKDEHEKKLLNSLMAKEKSTNKTVKKTIGINEIKISLE